MKRRELTRKQAITLWTQSASRAGVLAHHSHWKPIYSSQGGDGWGRGWQHHIGTGVTFRF